MRIFIDARNITARPAGVGRYAMALIPRLVDQAPEHDWVVIRHESMKKPLRTLLHEFQPSAPVWKGEVQEVWTRVPIDDASNVALGASMIDRVAREVGAPDLYHDLFHILPARLPDDLKVVVTLHDLVWIDHADASQPTWLKARAIEAFARLAIPQALARADHVISISKPTDERARQWLTDTPSTIIMHGVDERFFEPAPEANPQIDRLKSGVGYVVAIGNSKPYKNISALIEALRLVHEHGHTSLKACLVGDCEGLRETVVKQGLRPDEDVYFAGFASDVDLRRYLGHATAFVFPSLVEGFGLPPLEAMAMGIPTLVSDYEPMSTIAAGAALEFDPLDPSTLAEELAQIVENKDLAKDLSAEGRAHARGFSWDDTASKTLQVYQEVT